MELPKFKARNLLKFTPEELYEFLSGDFILIFDNGEELVTNAVETFWTSFLWVFFRDNPNVPILPEHHLSSEIKNKHFNGSTEQVILARITWAVINHSPYKDDHDFRDRIMRRQFEIHNYIYNQLIDYFEPYAGTIDSDDFEELVFDPFIEKTVAETPDDPYEIQDCYNTVMDYIVGNEKMRDNNLVQCLMDGSASNKQILQSITLRGFTTDVNGTIFKHPVRTNFYLGLYEPFQYLAETRSGYKAAFYTLTPLRYVEYQSRRKQIPSLTIERLHFTDCGTTDYIRFFIEPEQVAIPGVQQAYRGHLGNMVGKYYLDETTNQLKVIKSSDTHLVGTHILMRSPLKCKHEDPHGCCAVCFGQLSEHMFPTENLGHACTTTLNADSTQMTLSTKHYDANAVPYPIMLDAFSAEWFSVGDDTTSYYMLDKEKTRTATIIINAKEAHNLADLNLVNKPEELDVIFLTKIHNAVIEYENGHGKTTTSVVISRHGKVGYITIEFLRHIKENGWELDDKGNFYISLNKWDFSKPMFRLPAKEYSFANHADAITELLESRIECLESRHSKDSPVTVLNELYYLVNSKLNINIALLEVILLSIMVKSPTEYGLTRGTEDPVLTVAPLLIMNRSLGAAAGFERQHQVISNPSSFLKRDRPDSPFDVLIDPKNVINQYYPGLQA